MAELTPEPTSLAAGPSPRACGWPAALVAAAVVLLVYGLTTTQSTLWDRDEPRYAVATIEMLESGNYLYPTVNGDLRANKPILIYWLMSLPVRLWGPRPFALRCVSVLATAVSCLLVYYLGRRLFSRRVGLWAVAVMVCTPQMLAVGTAATPDAVLLATTTAAFVAVALWVTTGVSLWPTVLLTLALGAAWLVKGPVGALPVLSVLMMAWLGRRGVVAADKRFWVSLTTAAVVSLAVFLVWAIPATLATGGKFAKDGLGHQVIDRIFRPQDSHGGNFFLTLPFYFLVIWLGFFPWTLHLPAGLSAVCGGRLGRARGRALLLGWMVPTFVLMTLVATKLPHYILGIWPALALLVAATLVAVDGDTLNARDRFWLRAGVWFFAPVGVVTALALAAGPWFAGSVLGMTDEPWFASLAAARLPCFIGGVVLLVTTVLAVSYHRAGRVRAGARAALGGYALFLLICVFGVIPAIEPYKPVPALAAAIHRHTAPGVPVWTCRFGEASLFFHVNRPPVRELPANATLEAWAVGSAPGVLVIPRRTLDRVEAAHGKLPLREFAAASGWDVSKVRWLELVALARGTGTLRTSHRRPPLSTNQRNE